MKNQTKKGKREKRERKEREEMKKNFSWPKRGKTGSFFGILRYTIFDLERKKRKEREREREKKRRKEKKRKEGEKRYQNRLQVGKLNKKKIKIKKEKREKGEKEKRERRERPEDTTLAYAEGRFIDKLFTPTVPKRKEKRGREEKRTNLKLKRIFFSFLSLSLFLSLSSLFPLFLFFFSPFFSFSLFSDLQNKASIFIAREERRKFQFIL